MASTRALLPRLRLSSLRARSRPGLGRHGTALELKLGLSTISQTTQNACKYNASIRPRQFSTCAPRRSDCQERWPNSLVTLAIETSCDDTCVAILEKERDADVAGNQPVKSRLLFEERITADNRKFKGIHPLTAAIAHTTTLGQLVQTALAYLPSGTTGPPRAPDFVAVTRGPGMQSSLVNGLGLAKGLALAWRVPLLGVHHMQAHALTPRLVSSLAAAPCAARFPYLSFLVSGGHTMLVHSRSLCDHRVLATAHNIAIGDLLDKCARALLPQGHIDAAEAAAGRSLPFGALLESFVFGSNGTAPDDPYQYTYPLARRDEMVPFASAYAWRLDPPLGSGALRNALRFDFSGLNGQVNAIADAFPAAVHDDERRMLARGVMHQAFEHLASRLVMALKGGAGADATCLVVAGGVASNRFLRHVLRSALDVHGYGHLAVVAPPPALCTDNAAMVAWAGMEMYEAGWASDMGVGPIRKWSMDPTADDGGILGIGGWIKSASRV